MKVIIVGAGIMGLATAWACRRRNMEVVVYEQHAVPNPLGTSVDDHRQMFRSSYGDDNLCLLNDAAYGAWALLWRDLDACHFRQNGTLLLARAAGDIATTSALGLARLGFRHETLECAVLARRYPHLNLAGTHFGLLEPEGGTLYARRIVAALALHLRARGVTINEHANVAYIDSATARVTLAEGRVDSGDRVVVAAGPWCGRLLPHLRTRVAPSRRVVIYLEAPQGMRQHWANAPDVVTGISGIYLVPPDKDTGLKVGFHRDASEGDLDAPRTVRDAEAADAVRKAAGTLTSGNDYRLLRAQSCFYDMSLDERCIIEPGDSAWWLTGFSGHGFSLGALAGCKVAQALANELDADIITRLFRGDAVPAAARDVA